MPDLHLPWFILQWFLPSLFDSTLLIQTHIRMYRVVFTHERLAWTVSSAWCTYWLTCQWRTKSLECEKSCKLASEGVYLLQHQTCLTNRCLWWLLIPICGSDIHWISYVSASSGLLSLMTQFSFCPVWDLLDVELGQSLWLWKWT